MSDQSPMQPSPPLRGPDCPPTVTLLCVAAGESVAPQWQEHLTSCQTCSSYVAALRTGADRFVRQQPPELFVRKLGHRRAAEGSRRPGWWAPLFAGLGAAAALVVAFWMLPVGEGGEGLRMKGSEIAVTFRRPGAVDIEPVRPGATLRPGDVLSFVYRGAADAHVAIIEKDGHGAVTPFFPLDGSRSGFVRGGGEVTLPDGVALDGSTGTSHLYWITAPGAFELAPWIASIRRAAPGEIPSVPCDGCSVGTLSFEKVR